MLGAGLQRGGQRNEGLLVMGGEGDDSGQHGLAGGQGPGLVHGDGPDVTGLLQGSAVLDEHAQLGAASGAHHDGHGRGQAHGAGAGHDQHRHEDRDGHGGGLVAEDQPGQTGQRGDAHDRGHEIKAHPVGQAGDGGLAALGLAHQPDDAGQAGILPHMFGGHGQGAFTVDAPGHEAVAGAHGHGDGFPGQQGKVHGALAAGHAAVHGDAGAGPDAQGIAGHDLGQRDLAALAVSFQTQGRFRRQAQQRAHGVPGLALGRGLQELAQLDHGQQHGHGFIIQVHGPQLGVAARKAQQGRPQAVEQGRARAHGHQAVHGGGLVDQGQQAFPVKMATQPDHGQGQGQLRQHEGAGRVVRVKPGGQGHAQHVPHGEDEQGHGKDQHGAQTPQTHAPVLFVLPAFFLVLDGHVLFL